MTSEGMSGEINGILDILNSCVPMNVVMWTY